MKIIAKIAKEVEKEIALPYFCKRGQSFFKVETENKVIIVDVYDFSRSIAVGLPCHQRLNIAMSEPCTEDEFLEALYKVSDFLQKQIPCIT
jgi:hypothetical protein